MNTENRAGNVTQKGAAEKQGPLKRVLMALSRNTYTSPYMQWYWRRLPEVQPVDIQPLLENLRRYGMAVRRDDSPGPVDV